MNEIDLSALNEEFGIPGQVSFLKDPADKLVRVQVANEAAQASLLLQGAQLLSWRPKAQQPVIWLSRRARFLPGKPVRGGVPICWPWFGAHAAEASFPAHGFARNALWQVIETQASDGAVTKLVLRLVSSDAVREYWTHTTDLTLEVSVGSALEMVLTTRNEGSQAVTFGEALHTYFNVSDVGEIAVYGLDACPYIDKVNEGQRKVQSGPVIIDGETDNVYLKSIGDCWIEDPGWQRRIRISKRGSRCTVVWNPWKEKARTIVDMGEDAYTSMVCVESANVADEVVSLSPGEEHRLRVRYEVQSLA